ncbi:hypothetical protein PVK06_006841 [Gossypium arboreum]|uniref:Uncharacterized protein n=1 Tax=Gossypium arboreum TaxID=29729 RepID=A0ABR0QGE0_GOSAR|nr:hypothetical protein PVK06_006841 [Gossypium arboreum]
MLLLLINLDVLRKAKDVVIVQITPPKLPRVIQDTMMGGNLQHNGGHLPTKLSNPTPNNLLWHKLSLRPDKAWNLLSTNSNSK